ncbi:hypothetical protein BC835DRAFT_613468 [Cytidiella melzeri]|nr:hypothetical protein BC835DRAFT_613468 [Cytidiella melzeri]
MHLSSTLVLFVAIVTVSALPYSKEGSGGPIPAIPEGLSTGQHLVFHRSAPTTEPDIQALVDYLSQTPRGQNGANRKFRSVQIEGGESIKVVRMRPKNKEPKGTQEPQDPQDPKAAEAVGGKGA